MSKEQLEIIDQSLQSILSDTPADITSDRYKYYQQTIPCFPEQAIYIYSFKERKLIYAKGWKNVLGYEDDEITMLKYTSSTLPKYLKFTNTLNTKTLDFLASQTEDLEKYSFLKEVQKYHKDGSIVPIHSKASVYKSEDGTVTEIIGICQVMHSLKFGETMKFSVHGPKSIELEKFINEALIKDISMTKKETETLSLISQGYTFKEVASMQNVSQSAIEKRIRPLFKRYNVKSLTHLISFAKDNAFI